MDYEISPEPAPEEREALVVALERLLAPRPPLTSWREAALSEGVEEEPDEDQATARPRSSRGARRA